MTKKIQYPVDIHSHTDYEEATADMSNEILPEPVPDPSPISNPYWEERDWMMGQLKVYRCRQCGTDRDQEDTIIEHILLHYPAGEEQEQKLTELLALKKET